MTSQTTGHLDLTLMVAFHDACLPRELHSRTSAGIQVSLWWSPADGRTWVAVRDVRTNAGFVLPVLAGERARDVFDHPYAYAARRGVLTARAA